MSNGHTRLHTQRTTSCLAASGGHRYRWPVTYPLAKQFADSIPFYVKEAIELPCREGFW